MRGFFIEKSIRAKIQKKPKRRMPSGSARHVIPAKAVRWLGIYALRSRLYYSFLFLDKKEAKNQGRHHRSFPRPSKCLTLRSWSAFYEGKRQAPLREGQALSQPFANASPHVGRASAPNPVCLWRTQCMLIINNKPDSKRQQTITVDYKRLFNGLVLTDGFSLRHINTYYYGTH